MKYEVQHRTIADGWVNTWAYADADGVMQPETFASVEEAEAALEEFLEDMEEEAAVGQMASYPRSEFRVWPVRALLLCKIKDEIGQDHEESSCQNRSRPASKGGH